jgi:hypothetical protein
MKKRAIPEGITRSLRRITFSAERSQIRPDALKASLLHREVGVQGGSIARPTLDDLGKALVGRLAQIGEVARAVALLARRGRRANQSLQRCDCPSAAPLASHEILALLGSVVDAPRDVTRSAGVGGTHVLRGRATGALDDRQRLALGVVDLDPMGLTRRVAHEGGERLALVSLLDLRVGHHSAMGRFDLARHLESSEEPRRIQRTDRRDRDRVGARLGRAGLARRESLGGDVDDGNGAHLARGANGLLDNGSGGSEGFEREGEIHG